MTRYINRTTWNTRMIPEKELEDGKPLVGSHPVINLQFNF